MKTTENSGKGREEWHLIPKGGPELGEPDEGLSGGGNNREDNVRIAINCVRAIVKEIPRENHHCAWI